MEKKARESKKADSKNPKKDKKAGQNEKYAR